MTRDVALVYVRISRDDPEREKISPSMQRDMCLGLPELNGLRIELFQDIGISGKDTAARPGFQGLLARLSPDVRYVVAYDQSRVTRSVADLQHFRDALSQHGSMFIEASMRRLTDPNDEDQELGSNIMGSVDQHYRKKVARRVRDALSAKVAGGNLVGPVPAGYVRRKVVGDDGRVRSIVEIDTDKAPIIRLLFREYASGLYSFLSLAAELRRRDVPLPRPEAFHNGRPPAEMWSADVVKDLIGNPRYVGHVPRRDGQSFKAAYPPLIDEATWAACERVRLKGRPSRMAGRRGAPYLLSGLLRCSRCGSSVSGEVRRPDRTHPTERRRYSCYRRRVARACDLPYLEQEHLEGELLTVLAAIALPDGFAEAVDAAVTAMTVPERRAARKVTLRSITERQRRLNDMYELGRIERNEFIVRSNELEQQAAALRAHKPEPLFARQRATIRTLVDDWEVMTLEERKRLLALVFAQIDADETGVQTIKPRDEWRPYVLTVLQLRERTPALKGGTGALSPVFRSVEALQAAGTTPALAL